MSSHPFKNINHIFNICVEKGFLNDLQWLICHKTVPSQDTRTLILLHNHRKKGKQTRSSHSYFEIMGK